MSKIVLDEITSGYQLSKVNENFQRIEDELNNRVLYRNAPDGEANTVEKDIDLNGKKLYNVGDIQFQGFDSLEDLLERTTTAAEESEASKDAAEVAAENAAISAASASTYSGSAVVRTFSGDGSTVDFNLTAVPRTKENTQVYIGSVYQRKSTYSVTDNILTFNTAPPAGTNNIEVVIFESVFVPQSGYTIPVVYASGIVLSQYNQLVEYNSEFYKLKAGQAPYTTTGTWSTDSEKLVAVGDAALRQELLTNANDFNLIPEVTNYDAVRAGLGDLTVVYVRGKSNIFDGGAGVFRLKSGDTTTADNGGTVLVDDVSGARYFRDYTGPLLATWFEGVDKSGATDSATGIQAFLTAISNNSSAEIPSGQYQCGNYTGVYNKSGFNLNMVGVLVPTGDLSNVNTALLNFEGCSDFQVRPHVVNASYGSTLNIIRLYNCQRVKIADGVFDVRYVGFDGTAAVQISDDTADVEIVGNYICSGYGVLGNDRPGTARIRVHGNLFVGQKVYGSLGTGDAVEANYPTVVSNGWYVDNNIFTGYEVHNPGGFDARVICVGMANVDGFSVNNNVFTDSELESIHIEDGCRNGTVIGNIVDSGIIGAHLQPNSSRDIENIVISGNKFTMPAMPSHAAYFTDYGAAILVNVAASTGICKNVVIDGNVCVGTTGAARGIAVYSLDGGSVTDNIVRDFPRAGYDIRQWIGPAGTANRLTVTGNASIANGWNYIVGGVGGGVGPFTNSYFDESNISEGSLFGLNYNIEISDRTGSTVRVPYSAGPTLMKLSAGDLLVYPDGVVKPVTVGGTAGVWKAADGAIEWAKAGSGTSNTVTITFASYAMAAIPAIVEITATGIAANGTAHEAVVAKFAVQHLTGAFVNTAFGTSDVFGGPITITPSISGLSAIYTVGFTSGYNHVIAVKIYQPNIHDQSVGGVASIS